tara:strand:+ start:545 stop:850 length:306 start_codon:yes stop_codon:yes gene_type:complete
MMLAGLIGAAGMLLLCFKFGIRRVISYDIFFDIAITAVLMFSLAGTYSGMMAALVGGLIVSIILFVMKKFMHREELIIELSRKSPFIHFVWVKIEPDIEIK